MIVVVVVVVAAAAAAGGVVVVVVGGGGGGGGGGVLVIPCTVEMSSTNRFYVRLGTFWIVSKTQKQQLSVSLLL